MDQSYNLVDVLEAIDPARLNYEEWLSVGMGLKEAGYRISDWERWSQKDIGRYHAGECARKWETFRGSSAPVTGGTIVQLAKDQGWQPAAKEGHALDWDDEIGDAQGLRIVDTAWVEETEVQEPGEWNPAEQLIRYLETLFEAGETVGYVTESWQKEDRYLPTKGCWDRTAGQLIERLSKEKDIGAVLGDCRPEAGAWIRFNPLDGQGCKNENVTEYRYALVESDSMEIARQNAILRELELPIAALVHSGGKSLHAIVKIEAGSYEEYRKRVDYLYEVCQKNGLDIDRQNKNPSRLSRMPGVLRNGNKQYLVDTNIGKESWAQWKEWIESVNDDLPDPESLSDVWDNLPPLSPPLIDGILRRGHKLLLAGPSKAGKSYALIELAIAIAEGRTWLSWPCTRGRVMYVNLELDPASCLHRFRDVYDALGWKPHNLSHIDIWNLRGKSAPMDKLAPKLIRRALKKNYIAVIIDPIYKVITGDENSADQMARFCNQFDLVCTELGCAVIYCHHHSKGGQGQKRSMDRASGSGVFARDPDALLDLIELEISEDTRKQKSDAMVCQACVDWLQKHGPDDWEDRISQDALCSKKQTLAACESLLPVQDYRQLLIAVREAETAAQKLTAWRMEGTLREFPKFAPVDLWFDYPIHLIDTVGTLKDVVPEGEQPFWKRGLDSRKSKEERKEERKEALETAFDACGIDNKVTVSAMAEYMGVSEKTIKNRIKEHGGFWIDGNEIGKK